MKMSLASTEFEVPVLPLLTLVCGQLLMVGSFAPWGTAPGFEQLGIEGDGAVSQVMGVYTSVMSILLIARVAPRRYLLPMLLVGFLVASGIALLNLVNLDGRIDPPQAVTMGWGLPVTAISAIMGSLLVAIQLIGKNRSTA